MLMNGQMEKFKIRSVLFGAQVVGFVLDGGIFRTSMASRIRILFGFI
jgi:hypothetical protein